MSRSVSVPNNAVKVAYARYDDDPDFFNDALCNAIAVAQKRRPSLKEKEFWLDRECLVFLSNDKVAYSYSTYNGLVAIAAVPLNGSARAEQYADDSKLYEVAECFGNILIKMGTASNGEAFFTKDKGNVANIISSKEGYLP
jgi:hypothetical protein